MEKFLAGFLQGLSTEECARLGNATSAHCVGAVGCTSGVKTLEETQAFQESHGG